MKMPVLFLIAATVATHAFADDPKAAFDAGRYAEAAKQLEPGVLTGAPSAEAFANLALAQQKAGDSTAAALNYERALLLDPGLKSAHNALAGLAQAQHIPLPPNTWVDDVNAVVHPDTLIGIGAVLFWLGAFGWVLAAPFPSRRGIVRAAAAVAVIFGGAAVAGGCLADPRLKSGRPAAVTAKDGAEVLTAPTNNSDAILSLPAGAPVEVLSPRGAWTYVDLAGGAKGWVSTDRLTPLVPGEKL